MQIGGSPESASELEWWFRANAAVISFLPPTMWLLQSAIVAAKNERAKSILKSLPLFALASLSSLACWTQSFISRDVFGQVHRGHIYYIASFIGLVIYVLFLIESFRKMRANSGIRRVELQFLAINAGGAALLLLGVNAFGNLLHNRSLTRFGVLLVFAASALTACALLMHRVFNAWEVFLQVAQRLSFAFFLSGGTYVLWRSTNEFFAEPFALLFSIAVFSPIAFWLDKQSRRWFDIAGTRRLGELRQHAIEIERAETKPESLLHKFTLLMCSSFDTRSAYFLSNAGPFHRQGAVLIEKGRAGYQLLCELGWATPESLDRRRPSPSINDLKHFLEVNSIGLIVPVPRGSMTPSLLVALATRPDERPFTFPEIERAQNLAELIDSILTRAKFAVQAAFHARTEYLGMMSRGLAHDLKNLITPVSTLLHHTDGWFKLNSVEAEVHAAAQRAATAMTDYVRETLSFSDRLEPSFERVRVKDICDAVFAVTLTPAKERHIQLVLSVSEFDWIVADNVLVQRMLCNFILNSIDASTAGNRVSLSVTKHQPGWMRFEVRDNGCGIPLEHMNRILDPYFTTKKSGGNVRGFGLGLTIAYKIVLLHRGSMTVQSKPGEQTVVSVELPTEQAAFTPRDLSE
jgi:signal transduction histidine kinase